MLKDIQVLTKRIKQIEMSVLALQVLNKWKIPTSLKNTSETKVSCGASTKPTVETKTTKKELTTKTESVSSFTIPKRIKKFRPGPLRVTYQDGDSSGIKDHEGVKKITTRSDGTDANVSNVVLQTWSRINGLKRKEVFSSLSSYAAADGLKSRLAAFPARSQSSKPNLITLSLEDKAKNFKKFRVDSGVSSRDENKDVNENFPKPTEDQATSDSFFCEDKFYDEDLQREKDTKTEEKSSSLIQKSSKTTATDREDSEKRKKEVDDFKKKRREERDQKLKRQEEQQKARISFNKTEYKRDLDNDSKKKIKELADSLKHKEGKSETSKSSKKDERTDVESSSPKSEKLLSKKEDRSQSSSPKRSVRNKHRDSSEDRHRSKSRRRSRSRERTSRGGRETILGIRQLRRSKSRSRSRSRSPRKRRREEKESRNSSTSSNSKSKAESKSSRVSDHKESLKEVNLFNDEYLKSCRDNKPKRLSRVQNKSRVSSNQKSCSIPGSASKISVPVESNEKKDDQKQRKKVTWTKDEDLVSVRFFEVIEEERGNVFKKKFEERRKLEAKNEKLKLSAVSLAKSSDERVCNKHEPTKDIFKAPVSDCSSSWPALIPLAGLRTDIRVGSESEEKLIQRAREAEVLPLPILASAEPAEAETIHQRRYRLFVQTPLRFISTRSGRWLSLSGVFFLLTSAEREPSQTTVREDGQINLSFREVCISLQRCLCPCPTLHYHFRIKISHKQYPWVFTVWWFCQRGKGANSLHLLGKRILSEWRCL